MPRHPMHDAYKAAVSHERFTMDTPVYVQRDEARAACAAAWQEVAELRAVLAASAVALEEAADKLWVFHCNAPNPPGNELSNVHRREDKEFMAEKSLQMTAAARSARALLARKPT